MINQTWKFSSQFLLLVVSYENTIVLCYVDENTTDKKYSKIERTITKAIAWATFLKPNSLTVSHPSLLFSSSTLFKKVSFFFACTLRFFSAFMECNESSTWVLATLLCLANRVFMLWIWLWWFLLSTLFLFCQKGCFGLFWFWRVKVLFPLLCRVSDGDCFGLFLCPSSSFCIVLILWSVFLFVKLIFFLLIKFIC